MRAFLLRYEEWPNHSQYARLLLGAASLSGSVERQAVQTGTKTLTEVKRESGDQDHAASSCRAFQIQKK